MTDSKMMEGNIHYAHVGKQSISEIEDRLRVNDNKLRGQEINTVFFDDIVIMDYPNNEPLSDTERKQSEDLLEKLIKLKEKYNVQVKKS